MIRLGDLPPKLNPLIKPLMEAIDRAPPHPRARAAAAVGALVS